MKVTGWHGRKWKNTWFLGMCLGIAVVVIAGIVLIQQVGAAGRRTYELRIYHASPDKLKVMEERFRDKTSKILARHGLSVIGYWTNDSDKLFVFLLSHKNKAEAADNWRAVVADPDFQAILKSEETEKTLEKSETIWLQPTDFSHLK